MVVSTRRRTELLQALKLGLSLGEISSKCAIALNSTDSAIYPRRSILYTKATLRV